MTEGRHLSEEHKASMAVAQRKRFDHARDYGELRETQVQLACDQIVRLPARLPVAEHVRRAVDLYLMYLGKGVG